MYYAFMQRFRKSVFVSAVVVIFISGFIPSTANPINGKRCGVIGARAISNGILYRCVKVGGSPKWIAAPRCRPIGSSLRIGNSTYDCRVSGGKNVWKISVTSAPNCPDTTFNTVASSYGLTGGQALGLTSNFCASREVLAALFSDKAKEIYPGLAGHVSSTLSTDSFLGYYVRNVEHGLELTPGSVNPYSDPLIAGWLRNGFPTTTSNLESDIRNDERFKNTQRFQYAYAAIGYRVLCDFGDTQSCALAREYSQLSNSLGPLTVS